MWEFMTIGLKLKWLFELISENLPKINIAIKTLNETIGNISELGENFKKVFSLSEDTGNSPEQEKDDNNTNVQVPRLLDPSTLKIFVAHDEKEIDRGIANEISTFLVKKNYLIFSENHIQPSENREERIEKELKECDLFIVLLSANENTPIRNEVTSQLIKVTDRQNRPRILPILINCELSDLEYYVHNVLLKIEPLKWTKSEDIEILKEQIVDLLQSITITMSTREISVGSIKKQTYDSELTVDRQIIDFIEKGKLCYLLSSPLSKTRSKILNEIKIEIEQDSTKICILNEHEISISYQPGDDRYHPHQSWCKKIINKISSDFNCECTEEEWQNYIDIAEKQLDVLFSKYIEDKIINNNNLEKVIIVFNGFQIKSDDYNNNDVDNIIFKNKFWRLIKQFYKNRNEDSNYKKLNFILIDDISPSQTFETSKILENSLDEHLFFGWGVNINDLSISPMQPKLTKYLKNVERDQFMQAIFSKTNGNELLTRQIVQEAFAAKEHITKGKESEFIDKIIKKLKLKRN